MPAGVAVDVSASQDARFGDYQTNIAMIAAKAAKTNPRELAGRIAAAFDGSGLCSETTIAGPGFINFRLNTPIWHDVLKSIATQGADFGRADIGKGEAVNIEYVSANPTGPMHVGHTRGAVFGDALATAPDADAILKLLADHAD